MKRSIMLLGVMCLCGLNLTAVDTSRGPVGFEAYDTNKDNSISHDEFTTLHKERLKAREASGMPMRNVANAPEFTDFDSNKDGKITKEEFQKAQLLHQEENRQNRGAK